MDKLPTLEELKNNGLPPRVDFTQDGAIRAMRDRKRKQAWLNPKIDSERTVKGILASALFRAVNVRKDGDYKTESGFYTKKTADYTCGLSLLVGSGVSQVTNFSEVKGVSPGNDFYLGNLDKRNNPDQPSQFEKLTAEYNKRQSTVFLWLVWWSAHKYAKPEYEKKKSRTYTRWVRDELYKSVYVINWKHWLDITLKLSKRKTAKRTFRRKDLGLIANCEVVKVSGRWALVDNHWIVLHLPSSQIAMPF